MRITTTAPFSIADPAEPGDIAAAQTRRSVLATTQPRPTPRPRRCRRTPATNRLRPGDDRADAARGDRHTGRRIRHPITAWSPGDKLRIEVYRDAQLSQSLQIRPDGKITLPLIGDVPAAGRTVHRLRDSLATSLKEYNTNPVVTVIVVETVPPVFYVMGEVNTPGTFPIKGQVSAVQALAMAGGFKDFAKTKDIKILRKGGSGRRRTSSSTTRTRPRVRAPAVFMQPGDTIIVP